jgi:putative tryptophan/tyrosine transport system ATP-binding protein
VIVLEHLSKTYKPESGMAVQALRPLELTIARGEFTVIVGANGSGKSTLLDLICGAQQPTSGRITIDGIDVTRRPEHQRSRWIGRVFQNPLAGTAAELSILDNFRLAALRTQRKLLRIGKTAAFRAQVRDQIAQLGMGLENKLEQSIGSLSGGQRQALTLLMSSMDTLSVLLLDEPTAALDPGSAQTVMVLAQRLICERNLTALLVTHNLREALSTGDRLIQLTQGSIARDLRGSAKSSLAPEQLQTWFHSPSL